MFGSKFVQADVLETYNVHNAIKEDVIRMQMTSKIIVMIHLIILEQFVMSKFGQFI